MARPVDPANVFALIRATNNFNASAAVGITVKQALEAVGDTISERTVRRIFDRPEFGFRRAEAKVLGAATYWHDVSAMTWNDDKHNPINQAHDVRNLLEKDQLNYLVQNLNNAIKMLDPDHEISQRYAEEEAKLKADKQKDFFDWYLGTTIVRRLTEQTNAKETIKGFSEYSIEQFRKNMRKHLEKPDVDWVLFFMFSLEMLRRQAIKDNGGKLPD